MGNEKLCFLFGLGSLETLQGFNCWRKIGDFNHNLLVSNSLQIVSSELTEEVPRDGQKKFGKEGAIQQYALVFDEKKNVLRIINNPQNH